MFKLWKILPHSWMTKPCKGTCGCTDFHTHDTTTVFRVAYGTGAAEAAKRAMGEWEWKR